MKLIPTLSLSLLLMCAIPAVLAQTDASLYPLGQEAMAAGRLSEAIAAFEAAVHQGEEVGPALVNLGVCYEVNGQFEQAVPAWERYLKASDADAARFTHVVAMEKARAHVELLKKFADAEQQLKTDPRKAAALLREAVRDGVNASPLATNAYGALADLCPEQKLWQEICDYLQPRIAQKTIDRFPARLLFLRALSAAGKNDLALRTLNAQDNQEFFLSLGAADRKVVENIHGRALILCLPPDESKAHAALTRVTRMDVSPDLRAQATERLIMLEEKIGAAARKRGDGWYDSQHYGSAKLEYLKITQNAPRTEHTPHAAARIAEINARCKQLIESAEAAYARREYETAVDLYNDIVMHYRPLPNTGLVMLHKGSCERFLNRIKEAEASFKRLCDWKTEDNSIDPTATWGYFELGRIYWAMGPRQREKAFATWRAGVKLLPETTGAEMCQFALVSNLHMDSQDEIARKEAKKFLGMYPQSRNAATITEFLATSGARSDKKQNK